MWMSIDGQPTPLGFTSHRQWQLSLYRQWLVDNNLTEEQHTLQCQQRVEAEDAAACVRRRNYIESREKDREIADDEHLGPYFAGL